LSAALEPDGRKRTVKQGEITTITPGDRVAIDNREQPRPLVARLIRFGDVEGGRP